jgi:peptidoglycan/xylan/chitin deacetylase (PgdA/CDA1 family)
MLVKPRPWTEYTALLCWWILAVFASALSAAGIVKPDEPVIPILVYHRFAPVRCDSMTVTVAHFEQQLDSLAQNGYTFTSLESLIAWRLGYGPVPAKRPVVLTIDDGHISVYRGALPIIARYHVPTTLFIYPSCIGRAAYAMNWKQLSELSSTSFVSVQSHTYWHPNFKKEAQRLDAASYAAFVEKQLQQSKATLETRTRCPVRMLAWPFGLYDDYLCQQAAITGYYAGFSIECRAVTMADPIMALPRCMVPDREGGPEFIRFIKSIVEKARKQ